MTHTTAFVGAPERPSGGGVYVFDPTVWGSESDFLDAGQQNGSLTPLQFGHALDASDDLLIVGAPGTLSGTGSSIGAAFAFRESASGHWDFEHRFDAPSMEHTAFGAAVSVDGDLAVVGSPWKNGSPNSASVHPYRFDGINWIAEPVIEGIMPEDQESFGSSVAIAGDWLAIGSPGEHMLGSSGTGAVYLFKRVEDTWTLTQRVTMDVAGSASGFGANVEFGPVADGTLAIRSGGRFFNVGEAEGGVSAVDDAVFVYSVDAADTWTLQIGSVVPVGASSIGVWLKSIAISGSEIFVGADEILDNDTSFHTVWADCLGEFGCPADLNGDGEIGFEDLTLLLADYGVCPTGEGEPCPSDLNADGEIGFQDLTAMLGLWGPCESDFDGDGLPDAWERVNALDPCSDTEAHVDFDGDGLSTWYEYVLGTDPRNEFTLDDTQTLNDGQVDSDNDGLTNAEELINFQTNPFAGDTDGDGLPDFWEVLMSGMDPNVADAFDLNNDGLPDAWQVMYDAGYAQGDTDGDGLSNIEEFGLHTFPNNRDSDGDDWLDPWEVELPHLDPVVPDLLFGDADGDGYADIFEFLHGTDLYNEDSDGDGLSDWFEVQFAGDPLSAAAGGPDSDELVSVRTYLWSDFTESEFWSAELGSNVVFSTPAISEASSIQERYIAVDTVHPIRVHHVDTTGACDYGPVFDYSLVLDRPPNSTLIDPDSLVVCEPSECGDSDSTLGKNALLDTTGVPPDCDECDVVVGGESEPGVGRAAVGDVLCFSPLTPNCEYQWVVSVSEGASYCAIASSSDDCEGGAAGAFGEDHPCLRFTSGGVVTVVLKPLDPECDCKIWKRSYVIESDFELIADPATHLDNSYLGVLPSDDETLLLESNVGDVPVRLEVDDPSVASFVVGSGLVGVIDSNTPPASVMVRGLGIGETTIVVKDASGEEIDSIPVKVGGTISYLIHEVPKFKPQLSAGGDPPPGGVASPAQGESEPPGEWEFGGGEYQDGGRAGMRPELVDWVWQQPHIEVWAWVEIVDADGRAKKGKNISIYEAPHANGQLFEFTYWEHEQFTFTDEHGSARFQCRTIDSFTADVGVDASVVSNQVAVLFGRHVQDMISGVLDTAYVESLMAPQGWDLRTVELWEESDEGIELTNIRLAKEIGAPASSNAASITISFLLPAINEAQSRSLRHNLFERDVFYPDPHIVPELTQEQEEFLNHGPVLESIPGLPEGDLHEIPVEEIVPFLQDRDLRERYMGVIVGRCHEWGYGDVTLSPDAESIFVLGESSLALEIAIEMIPGKDLYDITKELLKAALGEEADWVVVAIATIGLWIDGGYAIPGGQVLAIIGNYAVAIAKVVLRRMTKAGARALLKMSDTLFDSMGQFINWVSKFMSESNYNPVDAANSINRQLSLARDSVLNVGDEAVAGSIRVSADFFSRSLSDEAFEGMAAFIKHGQGGLDTIDDAIRKIDLDAPLGNSELATESMESICAALQRSYHRYGSAGPDGTLVLNAGGRHRIDDAMVSAAVDSSAMAGGLYRNVVGEFVGSDKPFKCMQEFEACRFIRAQELRPDQVEAIKAMRASIAASASGPFVKVLPQDAYVNYVSGAWQPKVSGSVMRKTDVQDLFPDGNPVGETIESLRLDYEDSPFVVDGYQAPYTVLEMPDVGALQGNAKVPKGEGFETAGDHLIPDADAASQYPFTGNGFIATTDSKLRPEYHFGDEFLDLPEGTVMKWVEANGEVAESRILTFVDGNPQWVLQGAP